MLWLGWLVLMILIPCCFGYLNLRQTMLTRPEDQYESSNYGSGSQTSA
jgi:hypothetical protein